LNIKYNIENYIENLITENKNKNKINKNISIDLNLNEYKNFLDFDNKNLKEISKEIVNKINNNNNNNNYYVFFIRKS
jgi:hypothetical protein